MIFHKLIDKGTRAANTVLRRTFGEDKHHDPKVWLHWQNLNDNSDGEAQGEPWEGRVWLHVREHAVEFSWHLKPRISIGASATANFNSFENFLTLGGHFGLLSTYLNFGVRPPKILENWWNERYGYDARCLEISLNVDDMGGEWDMRVYGRLWSDPHSWSSTDARWRDWSVHPIELVLGSRSYERVPIIEDVPIEIHMPEGAYEGEMTFNRTQRVFKNRKTGKVRRFSKPFHTIDARFPYGIPHYGKGEALYGLSCPANSIADGIGKVVACVMKDRMSRKGRVLHEPYPHPSVRKAAAEEAHRAYRAARKTDPSLCEVEEVK